MGKWNASAADLLRGTRVQLERLRADHIPELERVFDPEIFKFYPRSYSSASEFASELLPGGTLSDQVIPYAVRELSSGRLVGQSEYMAANEQHRRVEIGGTWYGKSHQGTLVNPECKWLMMKQAFEDWDALRVEFKTDSLNLRSQAALAKLGAVREGILRNHMLCSDGRRRHSVYFSVIAEEWSSIRSQLDQRLSAGSSV